MANSFDFIQQWPAIQKALDQAHGLGLDNIAFNTFVDVGDRDTIWKTLFSDGILTFESDYKCPFKHIAATIEPVQSGSGDPSPDNVRPITGWTGAEIQGTGKNLLPNKKYQDTSIRVQLGQDSADYFLMKAGTYKLSYGLTSGITAGAYWRVRGGAVQNSTNIVLAEDSEIQIWLYRNPLSADDVLWWQLELGSTATAYEPYQGDSISINWQDEAGTVYGGTLVINEDGSVRLVVDKYLYVYDGTEQFSKSGNALNGFYNQLSMGAAIPHNWPRMFNYGTRLQITDERSSMFKPTRDVNAYKHSYGYVFFDSGHNFDVPPETFGTTVDSFKAKLAELYAAGTPVSVFCKIATPITYTLPSVTMLSTVLGTNNIWSSTGGIAVTYKDANPLFLTDPLNVGVMTLK